MAFDTTKMGFALGLGLLMTLLGGCNASLTELAECGQLAEAVCNNADDCGYDLKRGACARRVTEHCELLDEVSTPEPKSEAESESSSSSESSEEGSSGEEDETEDCVEDLEDMCLPEIPSSCGDLAARVGCSVCDGSVPDEEVVTVCCLLNRFSAVCGGCQ